MIKPIYNLFHNHYHRRYHGVYAHAKQLFIFDMFLLAFGFVLLGGSIFFFLWKPGVQNLVNITLSLGNERLKSGDKVHLVIDYDNNSKVELTNAVLAVRLPRGFEIDKNQSDKFNFENNSIDVGNLPPGSKGIKNLYGTLLMNVGETERIYATLSYKQENKNNREQSTGLFLANLSDSVIKLTASTTANAFAGQRTTYSARLENSGKYEIKNATVYINGKPLDNKFNLLPGSQREISEVITLPSRGSSYRINSEVKIESNGFNFTQASALNDVAIINPKVNISARLLNPPAYADPGSALDLEIMWKNESEFDLKNSEIAIEFTPGVVNLKKTASENRLNLAGGKLVVNSKTRTALTNIKPNNNETFTLRIFLNDNYGLKPAGINSLSIKPIFAAETDQAPGQIFEQIGNASLISLPAEAFIRAEARYYTVEGDQLGRGPTPPQVGKTTKYWIFATLFDKINPLSGNNLVFELAPGVSFSGKQSVTIGPELIYNEANRTLTWDYRGVIPAESESGFYFEVNVTPKPEQMGYILNLVNSVNYKGVDDILGKKFSLKLNNISNILPKTDKGSSGGAVVTE